MKSESFFSIKEDKRLKLKLGVQKVFLLDFSKSITGTMKDLKSIAVLKKEKQNKIKNIVAISSGNAGYSLGIFAKKQNRKVFVVVDKRIQEKIKKGLKKVCEEVKSVDLKSKKITKKNLLDIFNLPEEETIDATNGFHDAYGAIVDNIKDLNPDFIVLPVGSGELFYGVLKAVQRLKLKIKLIGLTPSAKVSLADKLTCKYSPYPKMIKKEGQSGYRIISLDEFEVRQAYKKAKKFMKCEPSSGIIFGVIKKVKFPPRSKVVFINTGKGVLS